MKNWEPRRAAVSTPPHPLSHTHIHCHSHVPRWPLALLALPSLPASLLCTAVAAGRRPQSAPGATPETGPEAKPEYLHDSVAAL